MRLLRLGLVLLLPTLAACGRSSAPFVGCPAGTVSSGGACLLVCRADTDCLSSEACAPEGVCRPRAAGDPGSNEETSNEVDAGTDVVPPPANNAADAGDVARALDAGNLDGTADAGNSNAPRAAEIVMFGANPFEVAQGESTTLSWTVRHGRSARIFEDRVTVLGDVSAAGGAMTVRPPHDGTVYTLQVLGEDGLSVGAEIGVMVKPPMSNAPGDPEPNDSQTSATAVAPGTVLSGRIDGADEDWFMVPVPDNGWVAARADENGGCALQVALELWKRGELAPRTTAEPSGACPSIDPTSNPAARDLGAADYLVRVVPRGGWTGSYRLEIRTGMPEGPAATGYTATPPVQTPYVEAQGAVVFLQPYGTIPAQDEGAAVLPLPFQVTFFGRSYWNVYVYSNGFVSFDPPPASSPRLLPAPFPSTAPMNNVIAPFWADLQVQGLGSEPATIEHFIRGTAPNRRFVIQFKNLTGAFQTAATHVRLNAQVVFGEDGLLAVHYGPQVSVGGADLVIAAGVEDQAGATGAAAFPCGARCRVFGGGAAPSLPQNAVVTFRPN